MTVVEPVMVCLWSAVVFFCSGFGSPLGLLLCSEVVFVIVCVICCLASGVGSTVRFVLLDRWPFRGSSSVRLL